MTGMALGYIGPGAPFAFSIWQGLALVGVAMGVWHLFRNKRD